MVDSKWDKQFMDFLGRGPQAVRVISLDNDGIDGACEDDGRIGFGLIDLLKAAFPAPVEPLFASYGAGGLDLWGGLIVQAHPRRRQRYIDGIVLIPSLSRLTFRRQHADYLERHVAKPDDFTNRVFSRFEQPVHHRLA